MSIFLLIAAPLIGAGGVNVGRIHQDCIEGAAKSKLQSSLSDEEVADYSMSKCRNLEPQLKEALDREWRTDRSGQVVEQPSRISQIMTDANWPRLLKARHDRLARDVHMVRQQLHR
jgi:hypothetical protein